MYRHKSKNLNFDILIIGKIVSIESKGILVAPRVYSPFIKGRALQFFPILGKPDPLPCSYYSLSEYHERWGILATSQEENKYLLPANWELIHSLLEKFKDKYETMILPERLSELVDVSANFHNWRGQLRQALSLLEPADSAALLQKYNQSIFFHPSTRLKFKWVHPEEVKVKTKMLSTISGVRSLHTLLNRKLEILPLFASQKNMNLEVLSSWNLPPFEGKTSFKYSQEWVNEISSSGEEYFKLNSFKEPILPFLVQKS